MFICVKKVEYLEDYKIEVEFNNGKKGIVDLEKELHGTMFESLKDKNIFSKVRFDEILETAVWEMVQILLLNSCISRVLKMIKLLSNNL